MKETVSFLIMEYNEGRNPSFSIRVVTEELLDNDTSSFLATKPFFFLSTLEKGNLRVLKGYSTGEQAVTFYDVSTKVLNDFKPIFNVPLDSFNSFSLAALTASELYAFNYNLNNISCDVKYLHPTGRYYLNR